MPPRNRLEKGQGFAPPDLQHVVAIRHRHHEFNAWFASVKDLLDEDVAGNLVNVTNDHEQRLTLIEYMTIHNDYFAPLKDDEGNTVLDDDGNAIMVDWKYKYA